MNSNWNPSYPYSPYTMRYGARVGGLAIAFQCIGVVSILAFGLTLMGIIMTAVSYNDPFDDKPFFAKHPNPIKIVGPVVLTFGLILAVGSIILCVLSVKTGRRLLAQQQSSQPVQTTVNTSPLLSQPYPSPNQGSQPYPQQPYPSPNQGSQPYPKQPYPSPSQESQPYPQQPYPSPSQGSQPYPQQQYPSPSQGSQPYPQQQYPSPSQGSQPYPQQQYPSPSQGSQPYPQQQYPSPSQGSQPYPQQPYPLPSQGSQPYPQQQANQGVLNKEFTDVSLPYPTSVNETSTPYAPHYSAQPAYNPSML